MRWVKIRKTCLLYTWALSLKIANHKNRNLWKLHVKLPFQIAKMKFTWNSLHENFRWYYHVTIFRQRFTWNSRENFPWMSHAVMLHVYIISSDYKRHRLLYMITKRKQQFFVCFIWQFVIYITQLNNNVIMMRSFIVISRILTHNYVFSFRYHDIFSRNYETTTLTIFSRNYFW